MTNTMSKRQFILGAAALSSLALFGCGGTVTASTTSVSVTPGLGAVYGATVAVYNARGVLLGTGTTGAVGSANAGKVNVTLTGYTAGTPVIIKVTLGVGAKYWNEKINDYVEITTVDDSVSLLSVMPAVTNGQSAGVTPLTNVAAALAGVSATDLGNGTLAVAVTDVVIFEAMSRTILALGLPGTTNLTAAPVLASADNLVPTDLYGAVLAAMAIGSSTDPVAQALALLDGVVDGTIADATVFDTVHTILLGSSGLPVSISTSNNTDPSPDELQSAIDDVVSSINAPFTPATGTGSGGGGNGG